LEGKKALKKGGARQMTERLLAAFLRAIKGAHSEKRLGRAGRSSRAVLAADNMTLSRLWRSEQLLRLKGSRPLPWRARLPPPPPSILRISADASRGLERLQPPSLLIKLSTRALHFARVWKRGAGEESPSWLYDPVVSAHALVAVALRRRAPGELRF